MENSSTSSPSPAWPTYWRKESFKLGASVLWLVAVFGALVAGAIVSGIVLVGMRSIHLALPDITAQLLFTAIAEVFALPFAWSLLPTVALLPLRKLGFVAPDLKTIGIAVSGVLVAVVAVDIVVAITDALTHATHPQVLTTGLVNEHSIVSIVIFVVAGAIVAPIAEETLFRLFLFNLGMRYFGFWWGAIFSSIVFGLAHGDLYNAPALAVVGLTFCGIYYYSRNAYASMIAHGLFNAMTIVAILIDPSVAKG